MKKGDYAAEKLAKVCYHLAVHPEDVKKRLEVMATEMHILKSEEIPEDLQPLAQKIARELTKRAPKHGHQQEVYESQGSVKFNLGRMHKATGSKIAKMLMELQEALRGRLQE